jgi:branched-chain amino acid transport system ATP-binding protein
MPALEVSHLAKSYGGVRAVHDVSFRVDAGELVALIGPNGAGKTTCFNMLMGQIAPDAGSVRIAGEDVTGRSPREIWRMGVGRTFQVASVCGSMTVRENVQTALLSHHRRHFDLWSRARELHAGEADALLARVGMSEQASRSCAGLAYGDVKRLELAVALANAPRLLLMDEPGAGMAPRERIALMALTADVVREQHIAVLFTEHDMDMVFAHASRILVLARGRLIAQGTADEVRADPEVRACYLGSRSLVDA